MTWLKLESAGDRRVRWLTLLGLVLVPLLVGGVLLAGLADPAGRLDSVTAAIVNDDDGVEIDGRTVPLGRQLSAGLVEGAPEDAASPIDANFTWVLTDADDAATGLESGRYAAVVTIPEDFSEAATSFQNADDARAATVDVRTSDESGVLDGTIANVVASTATQIFGDELAKNYLDNIYVGFNTLGDQLGTAADGAAELGDGLGRLRDGTAQSASGAHSLAAGADQLASGAASLAGGLAKLQSGTSGLPGQSSQLATGAAGVATGVGSIAALAQSNPDMTLAQLDAALQAQGSSLAQLAAGAQGVAGGASALSNGLGQLSSGIAGSASGADRLANGAASLADGAGELASGLDQLADGTAQSAAGAQELADGLGTAVEQIPTYTADERQRLADVVAAPVTANGAELTELFGARSLPLLIGVALWVGAIASYLVLQAVTRRALTSRRSSVVLALGAYLPGLVVGVASGLLIAAITLPALGLDAGPTAAFAGVCALAGAAFAAVVQGLVALLRGAGRIVAAAVAVLVIAAGIVSTAPALLRDVAALLPIQPAVDALLALSTGSGGAGGAVALLVLWLLGGLALSTVAVVRQRTIRPRDLVALPSV